MVFGTQLSKPDLQIKLDENECEHLAALPYRMLIGLLMYSGLKKRCNVWVFWTDCDAVLVRVETSLSASEVCCAAHSTAYRRWRLTFMKVLSHCRRGYELK